MRIDDEFELIEYDKNDFDSTMNDIDKLISEISINENSLRNRKHQNGTYISSPDLDDIDDVVITINIPDDYYTNKERQIVKYNYDYILVYIVVIINNIINCLLNILKFFYYSKEYSYKRK